MHSKLYDVTGKVVHIGIDAHLANLVVCAVAEGVKLASFSYPADDTAGFISRLHSLFKGAKLKAVYEAGFSGFHLQRRLAAAGIEALVVNPGSIPIESRCRVKTDKIDALKLALLLDRGLLRSIRVPSVEEELRRELTRTRQQLVEARKRLGNQIKMKLHFHTAFAGRKLPAMTEKFLRQIEAAALAPELKKTLAALMTLWRTAALEIKKLTSEISQTVAKTSVVEIYQSAPGAGSLSACILSAELGDMSQFSSERQLFSFCGLTPSEYSSGDKRHQGAITRQGNARIRHIMTEVAWRAIRQDARLRQTYLTIAARRGCKRAIIAVARRMLGHMRACLRLNQPYALQPLSA